MDPPRMIKVYRTKGLAYRLATKTTNAMRGAAFEGELIKRQRAGENVQDETVRRAAAIEAITGVKLAVLKEDEKRAAHLIEDEVARLISEYGK